MKKYYKVEETKPNTYRKRPVWKLDREEKASLILEVLCVGFIVVRCLIG